MGYYNFKKHEKYASHCVVWMTIGDGDIGKTYAGKLRALEAWWGGSRTTVWVNGYKNDQDENYKMFFSNFAGVQIPETIKVKEDGVYDKEASHDGERFIIFKSINNADEIRGPDYSNCDNIIYDEFCPPNLKFPKDAPRLLADACNTVGRKRKEFKLIMLSNMNSIANPYFAEWRVYPKAQAVTVFDEASISIEIPKGYTTSAIERGNAGGGWDAFNQHVGYKRSTPIEEFKLNSLVQPIPQVSKRLDASLVIGGKIYGCWQGKNTGYYYWKQTDARSKYMYGTHTKDCSDEVSFWGKAEKDFLLKLMRWNVWRFADENALFDVSGLVWKE